MKTVLSDEQAEAILKAISKMNVRPYTHESSDPKNDAQRNLRGRTHYVDDETLRWHRSRVLSTRLANYGLLIAVGCSDGAGFNDRRRVHRVAVFDVFGTCVSRPKLEDGFNTSRQAWKAYDEEEFDIITHYRQAIERMLKINEQEHVDLFEALTLIP